MKCTRSGNRVRTDDTSGSGVRDGPNRECPREPLHFDLIVSPPLQFFVAMRAEDIDISFGLLAQSDLSPLDHPDDTGGEIYRSAEDIAFLDLQRDRCGCRPANALPRLPDRRKARGHSRPPRLPNETPP